MPPRITHDPTKDECPNYEGEDFANVRDLIIAGHQGGDPLTHEAAANYLKEAWQRNQDKKVADWNTQLQADQVAADEEEAQAQQAELQQRKDREKEEAEEKREAERKKPRINDFDPDMVIPGYVAPRPSGYALNKLKNLQYVELDYFTIRGCNEAQRERETTSDHDTFGLTRVENVATFQPISSLKPSKNIRRDEELSWDEMVIAKNKMVDFMNESGTWPPAHVAATMMLFVELENHHTRLEHLGNKIMVTYAARARRVWFDMLEQKKGFNLGKIGTELMRNITDEVRDNARQNELAQVRKSSRFRGKDSANRPFCFPSFSFPQCLAAYCLRCDAMLPCDATIRVRYMTLMSPPYYATAITAMRHDTATQHATSKHNPILCYCNRCGRL